jgi:hypothetical protein
MLLPRASLWTHPYTGRQRQHSNAVNVNVKEQHRKLLHHNLRQDKSSSKSINGGLFKPRKKFLALGSIFAVPSVNCNDDIWRCGNGGDQRWCDTCMQVDMACNISEFMFLHFNVVSANVISWLLFYYSITTSIDRLIVECSAVQSSQPLRRLPPTTAYDVWQSPLTGALPEKLLGIVVVLHGLSYSVALRYHHPMPTTHVYYWIMMSMGHLTRYLFVWKVWPGTK